MLNSLSRLQEVDEGGARGSLACGKALGMAYSEEEINERLVWQKSPGI
jgi:hypothetical protein